MYRWLTWQWRHKWTTGFPRSQRFFRSVLISYLVCSLEYIFLYQYLGDVGEPGLGGGYSQPGQKGEIGMCMKKRDKIEI